MNPDDPDIEPDEQKIDHNPDAMLLLIGECNEIAYRESQRFTAQTDDEKERVWRLRNEFVRS